MESLSFGNNPTAHPPGDLIADGFPVQRAVGDTGLAQRLFLDFAGGGTCGIGDPSPSPLEIPGERHKRFGLAIASALEKDWSEGMRNFERAFDTGWRTIDVLDFYGLIEDQYDLYGGFTESLAWKTWLAKVADSNEKDRKTLREQFPEVFSDIAR